MTDPRRGGADGGPSWSALQTGEGHEFRTTSRTAQTPLVWIERSRRPAASFRGATRGTRARPLACLAVPGASSALLASRWLKSVSDLVHDDRELRVRRSDDAHKRALHRSAQPTDRSVELLPETRRPRPVGARAELVGEHHL